MATLFNTKIKDTYQSLLKLEDNTILTTTSKNITDGLGNASPLYMSTTRIGIGTNTPANTLSVVGADNVNNLGVYGASGRLQIKGYLSATYGTLFESTTSGGALMPTTISASKILLLDGQVGINTTSTGAQLHIKGSGTTSSTTSLLVQNSSNVDLLKITDDSTFYFKGASGTTLRIKSGIEANSSTIQFNNEGLNGGYSGGYTFTNGFNGIYGTVVSLRIYQGKVGIGNITEGTMQNNAMNLYVDNTQMGGRNKAIKLNVNFANISTEYNGIQFDTIENGSGGAFIGSQYNTATSSYGSDLAIFTTADTVANSYTETARFVGKSQSLSIGAGKNPTARLQVQGTGSTSATTSLLVQNSSGLTALSITDDRTVSIGTLSVSGLTTTGVSSLTGQTNITGLSSIWQCQYAATGTVKPLSFSMQSGSFSANNSAIQFGFNYRASGGLFSQDIFQNILYDNTAGSVVTGFEWFTHQTQVGDASSQLALSLRGKTLSVGTNTPSASAILQADSTTQGVLFPRMTTAQKLAIASPVGGLQVFDTTLNQMSYYNGTAWINF
jgi:hypothetical protein